MSLEVAIVGDGVVSALGLGVQENLAGLYAGRVQPPGLGLLTTDLPDPPPVFAVTAPLDGVAARDGRPLSRTAQLALVALREAIAGLPSVPAERVGVVMGTTVGCTFNDEDYYRAFRTGALAGPPPSEREPFARYLGSELATVVSEELGALGPRLTVVNACASGTDAVGIGARWLASGRCDRVIAGGADALSRFPYLGFKAMNMSPVRCRPFDRERQGLNLGEGAAVLVLERLSDARRRGARCLGVVAGYGSAADAHHPTAPHPEGRGLKRAIGLALEEAGLTPRDIGLVNAHGTGTLENDKVEGQVLAALLPAGVPVMSTKGMTGHTLGAAGAIEAVFAARNLLDGRVPSSAGCETPDPACGLEPLRECRSIAANAALSDSLAFGGANAVLVLTKGDA